MAIFITQTETKGFDKLLLFVLDTARIVWTRAVCTRGVDPAVSALDAQPGCNIPQKIYCHELR